MHLWLSLTPFLLYSLSKFENSVRGDLIVCQLRSSSGDYKGIQWDLGLDIVVLKPILGLLPNTLARRPKIGVKTTISRPKSH